MMGVIYLFLCFGLGFVICCFAFPSLTGIVDTDYHKRKISVSPYLLLLPAWYLTGTLALTWATYLLAYLFRDTEEPLRFANLITIPLTFFIILFVVIQNTRKERLRPFPLISQEKRIVIIELLLVLAVVILAFTLMWTTFFVKENKLHVGVTVFSDFSPHLGMIRSFSYGNNFPTSYSHYAGEDIRYHFMFQFLTGNLEYLGLRIDYAFNIPSIISFITAFMLLYLLAVKITGKPGAGLLACLFFAFRSSKTLFTYLSELPKGTKILDALAQNTSFISSTPNEDWGLWNLNVYCNQRHLAFGLTAMFFLLLLYLPNLYDMFEELERDKLPGSGWKRMDWYKNMGKGFLTKLKRGFLTREAWIGNEIRAAIAAGILLGSLTFFHGAAVVGVLTILFIMAILSKRRLEYLITALITTALSLLQTRFFIHGSATETKFLFGFLAENKTIFGVASYLERLLGVLPFVLLVAFCIEKGVGKYLLLAFTAPLLVAFTISLTIDVTVNHKYIMMSCILLGIFAAAVVMKLIEQREFWSGLIAASLIIMLTATGIYDYTTVLKKNTPETAIILELRDPLTDWVKENSTSQDIFLTSNYTINQIVFGGAMLYEGWPYYPWSAGYNTDYRTEQVKQMYEAATPAELDRLIKENHIRYIVVDHDNRVSPDYILNENNIKESYVCVYSIGEGDFMTSIYDTHKPLQ
jgi:hypothetical protein